ncbi:hypothetical protein QNO21_08430 [Microbacterium sp. zg-Y818]|uniref:hypothetical protein n=1 Tax=unclassified Microbacterium TaxID=2609290 RepID=UPI00214BE214|nr:MULTISPECIES: hypothetical protein [unclassified Microbacterium]MCR2801330.1 hypothetical protein [Microbacterium sp. zg.Y818]WIM21159.1 hypothetical protein QNO21_08430 [Microbacterium sp. zg-Y818]
MQQDDSSHPRTPGSALAAELRMMPRSVLSAFRVPPRTPEFLDAIVATLHDLLATSDSRSLAERLEVLPKRFEGLMPGADLDSELRKLETWFETAGQDSLKADVERYARRFKNGSAPRFLRRLLGADRFLRLQQACEEDWALCLLAVRRALRATLPLAQALEDAVIPLTGEERDGFIKATASESVFLGFILKTDDLIEAFLNKRSMAFAGLGYPVRDGETATLDVDMIQLMEMLRLVLDVEMEARTSELSDTLRRKFRGFDQALNNSDDGVGQAATSLIELIDRLLRTAFSTNEVLAWVLAHRPDDAALVYERGGRALPTKRAEALCFAHAGEAPPDDPRLQEMLANSLVRARAAAQKIKHNDHGTPEEAAELRTLMQAARGAITFLFRVSWVTGTERYEKLQHKFAQAA